MKTKEDVLDVVQIRRDLTKVADDLRGIRRRLDSIEQDGTLGVEMSGVIGGTIGTLDAVLRDLFWVKESDAGAMEKSIILESLVRYMGEDVRQSLLHGLEKGEDA
jgi:hypothetical protein